MKVIASKGLRVPMETGQRRYVTDAAAVEVPSTAYYRRRISDGDLINVDAAAAATVVATDTAAIQDAAAPDASAATAGDKKTAKGA